MRVVEREGDGGDSPRILGNFRKYMYVRNKTKYGTKEG